MNDALDAMQPKSVFSFLSIYHHINPFLHVCDSDEHKRRKIESMQPVSSACTGDTMICALAWTNC